MANGYYLCAIARSADIEEQSLPPACIDGIHPLEAIYCDELCGIACEVDLDEFAGEHLKLNLQNFMWLEPKVRNHDWIARKLVESFTIIPVRFGSTFLSKQNLRTMLLQNTTKFVETIESLDGKWEMGVSAAFDLDKLKVAAAESESVEMKLLLEKSQQSSPGVSYMYKKKLEAALNSSIQKVVSQFSKQLLESAEKISEKVHELSTSRLATNSQALCFKIACLVRKLQADDFQEMLYANFREFDILGVTDLSVTGPWPPYSFANWNKINGEQANGWR